MVKCILRISEILHDKRNGTIDDTYINFSSKNAVKDSCASAISCKSSSNENASFTAFMT